MEKENSPDYKSPRYLEVAETWQRTQEFWEGLRALRKSSEYLTKFEKESPEHYAARRKAAELYNVFKGTIQTVVGIVFKSQIVPDPETTPDALAALFHDMDLMGSDLAMFLRRSFQTAARDGHSLILVDAPPALDPTERLVTLADVRGRRPFWRHYTADQLVNYRTEEIGGVETLIQATLYERITEPKGVFGEVEIDQWRVLRPGEYTLYRKNENDGDIYEYDSGVTGIDVVPLVFVPSIKKGLFESEPPYLNLLDTNVVHYNAVSVLRTALIYIVPMPVFTVDSEDDAKKFAKLVAAPNRSIVLWGANASATYLELDGKSIEELRIDIETLEKRMAKQGVEKFAPVESDAPKTAYEVGSDNRMQMSEVAVMASNLENAIESAFTYTSMYLNAMGSGTEVDPETKVRLRIDYDKLTYNTEQMEFLRGLVTDNIFSKESFLDILPQIIELPEGFDPAEERERLLRQQIDNFPEI